MRITVDHLIGPPSSLALEVASVATSDPEFVRPGAPELMRMDVGYSGLLAAALDHLLDAPVGHRPATTVTEPQLRPPLLRVPPAGTQVPVGCQSALRAE